MRYMIVPAKSLQCGDVIFTNKGDGKGIQFCGRVLGLTVPSPHPEISEYRVEVVVADESDDAGTHTTIGFRHATHVGVVREDEHVEVDVAALFNEIDDE